MIENKTPQLYGTIVLSSGGTSNYNDLKNIPSINEVPLKGDLTTEGLNIDIPTKVSELENDSKFITLDEVPETNLTNYYDRDQTDKLLEGKQPTGDYALKTEISFKKLTGTGQEVKLYELEDGNYIVDGSIIAKVVNTSYGRFSVESGSIIIKIANNFLIFGRTGTSTTIRLGRTGKSDGSIFGYDVKSSSSMPSMARFVLENEILSKTNTSAYTPTANYHPTTKKYVDDKIAELEARISALENPIE